MSTRLYLGKISSNHSKKDIENIVCHYGNITDFLFKDTYAFVVIYNKIYNIDLYNL